MFIEKKGYSVSEDVKLDINRSHAVRLADYRGIFDQWLSGFHYMGAYRKEIVKVLSFIHEHYKDRITLDDICVHVNLSRSHLSKLFKDHQGITVIEYVEAFG